MPGLIFLLLLTAGCYFWRKHVLGNEFKRAENDYACLKKAWEETLSSNSKFKDENAYLGRLAEESIALYDLTKEICKYLEEDKVFSAFCQRIGSYVEIGDCRLENTAELPEDAATSIFPLTIDKDYTRYLVVDKISKADQTKVGILAQQLLLALKRAFLYQKMQELAITDSLTQVFSRRYLLERLKEEIARSQKFGYQFSLLMMDIDHFKACNDRWGHLVGDAILKTVASVVKENVRQIDLVGRYGGEEFCMVLPETDKKEAGFVGERLRKAVEDKQIKAYDEELKVTVSIGIAAFPAESRDMQVLIDKADWALYRAKENGRNKVSIYGVYA